MDLNLIQQVFKPCLLPNNLLLVEDLNRNLGHGWCLKIQVSKHPGCISAVHDYTYCRYRGKLLLFFISSSKHTISVIIGRGLDVFRDS